MNTSVLYWRFNFVVTVRSVHITTPPPHAGWDRRLYDCISNWLFGLDDYSAQLGPSVDRISKFMAVYHEQRQPDERRPSLICLCCIFWLACLNKMCWKKSHNSNNNNKNMYRSVWKIATGKLLKEYLVLGL